MITTENAVKKGVKKGAEEKEIRSGDLVLVEYVFTTQFHSKGEQSVLHRVAADRLIASGKVKLVKNVEGGEIRSRNAKG